MSTSTTSNVNQRPETFFERHAWKVFLGMSLIIALLGLGDIIMGGSTFKTGEAATGQGWALWGLTAADLSMVPFWGLILARYAQAGAVPGPGELPPMVTYLVLIPVAAVLGWIGLR